MVEDDALHWYHLAVCQGMKTNWFYEDYESDPLFAGVMDNICLSCPVRSLCLRQGMEEGEYGLWGGVYLNAGRPDKQRNAHKDMDIWSEVILNG